MGRSHLPGELEVARLIVETLNLEDTSAAEIEPEAPLFGDGLGLDSIDALELSLMVSRQFGIRLRSDDPENVHTFASLAALTHYIEQHRV